MRTVQIGTILWLVVACGSSGGGTAGVGGGNTGGTGGTLTGGTGGLNLDGSIPNDGAAGSTLCTPGTLTCSGLTPQFCEANGTWSSDVPCPYACTAGKCTGSCVPGTDQCKFGRTQACGTDAEWGPKVECEFGCDTNGKCRTGCNPGEFNCFGNQVQQCQPGPPPQWVPTATTCNANSGQVCDKATGTCQPVQTTGGTTPTAEYYQYAIFQTNGSAFLGGYDVTSWGDRLYVNRGGQNLDVYKVTLLDSDGDGKLEPNQHPNNPNETGPIEQRVLELVTTYTKTGNGAPMGPASTSSLHAQSNNDIYSLGPTRNGSITLWDFQTQASSVVVQPATTQPVLSFIGYGFDEARWYGGNESYRRIYSFHEPTKSWVLEFQYPNLAGSHMDGMEVVVSPKTGEQFVYVTDMTSDFIGQYRRDDALGWVQEELFEYDDATSSAIEGFGFGTLNHFWAAAGTYLYELGGGDIQEDLEPCPLGKQACGGNNPSCPSGELCLGGCCSPNPCPNDGTYCGGGQSCATGEVCQNNCCISQCPSGVQACGSGLPACTGGKVCQNGCCATIG